MKKIKPWTGQKAWEEKQAQSAANEKSGVKDGSFGGWTAYDPRYILTIPATRHSTTVKLPNGNLDPNTPPDLKSSAASKRHKIIQDMLELAPYVPKFPTLGDPMDNLIFGGEDGDRDKDLRLPQGYGYQTPWINFDPAFEPAPKCCKPEDKVNIGFAHDKFACKVCGKDM